MLKTDRITLRNIVLAVLGGTGAALLIGTSCLGRPKADATAEPASIRTSAGGIPPVPVGTTEVTAAELERGASASGNPNGAPTGSMPSAPPVEHVIVVPAPAPVAVPGQAPPAHGGTAAPQAAPPAQPAQPAPTPQATPMPAAPPPATTSPPPATTPTAAPSAARMRNSSEGIRSGAGPFITEAPPWAASNMTSNPEAGAGPFTTDQITPR